MLRELREARRLSQEALADAAGCHVNHVSFLERGIHSASLVMLFHLATALGSSPSDVVRQVETRIADPDAHPASSEP